MPRPSPLHGGVHVAVAAVALLAGGCDHGPETAVVLDNAYPPASTGPLVVYRARWQAVAFPAPVPPGASSDPQSTVPASDNTAYVLLAPGWDPGSAAPPSSFVVLESRAGYGVDYDGTLHIPVDDATFTGSCAAGSPLSQDEADFITRRVFPCDFASLTYDAATCTTSPLPDAGASCDAY